MPSPLRRPGLLRPALAVLALAGVALCGCQSSPPPRPFAARKALRAARHSYPSVTPPVTDCLADAMAANASAPASGPRRLEVLALSGGVEGAAHTAGVIVGWTRSGHRPTFDVVTGVSSGALIGAFAFLGPRYDATLERLTLTLTTSDLFKIKPLTGPLLDGAFGSTAPAQRLLQAEFHDGVLADLRQAHAEGRRFFVGTMSLETRRLAVWDMGALASCGRPDAGDLVRKVLLAAFTYPGLAPPVELPADGPDGPHLEEHCDAGLVSMAFVRFGSLPGWPEPGAPPRPGWLAGSNLYVLASRKLYSDPAPVPRRALPRAAAALTATLQALAHAHINQLYALCAASGMKFHLLAAPPDYQGAQATFRRLIQEDAARQFALGRAAGAAGPPWRLTPPGAEPGEEAIPRGEPEAEAAPEPGRAPRAQPAPPAALSPDDRPQGGPR